MAVEYLETFACPLTREIIKTYLGGQVPDHLKIAGGVINSLVGHHASLVR